jgi:hypothetical protein
MKRQRLSFAVCVTILVLACSTMVANEPPRPPKAEKPIAEIEVFQTTSPSLEDLWQGSVAVLRARVIDAEAKAHSNPSAPGAGPTILTEARLAVSEVYKGTAALRQLREVKVYQVAGSVEEPTRILRVANIQPLHKGAEYLVFLGWNSYFSRWMVAGSDGVYEIRDGRLHAYGRSRLAQERDGARLNSVSDELHRLAARNKVRQ